MKQIKNAKRTKFDFRNKMYIHVCDMHGVLFLKHFTRGLKDVPADCENELPGWRWVGMDGRSHFNIYIQEPLNRCCFMEPTPQRAFDKMVECCKGDKFYVCDGIVDFIKNAHKVMKIKRTIQDKTSCILFK